MMTEFLPFAVPRELVMIAAAIILILLLVYVFVGRSHAAPYIRGGPLLTPAEQRFYQALQPVIEGRGVITMKVRIADMVKVKRVYSKRQFWRHFSQISQKHMDFVVMHPTDYTVLCAIELDDKSHLSPARASRDRFINQVMAQADIPLIRFPVRKYYQPREIAVQLQECLN